MKKILFSCAAAIISVASLSSFRKAHQSFTTYYYWVVATGSGIKATFFNSDLYMHLGTYPTVINPCNIGYVAKCVIGFTRSQVTGVGVETQLKTINGPKPNRITVFRRTDI